MVTVIAGVSGAIGQALAWRYLQSEPGHHVVGLCRQPEHLPEDFRQQRGLHLVAWDAAASGGPAASDLAVLDEVGAVTTVIYAAGLLHDETMFPEKRLEDLTGNSMARAFAVNCTGFGLLIQSLMPWLRGRDLKRVAAISAKVGAIGDNGLGGWYAYRCSKAALNMMVKNLSVELPRRVRPVVCVALHPGTTVSSLSEPFSQSLAKLTVHSPGDTADNLIGVLSGLEEADNGRFISWDGSDLPW